MATGVITATGTLRIGLHDPGMSALHRVGLGGLALTLEAIDRNRPAERAALHALGGSWEVGPRAVVFTFTGDGKAFFKHLIEVAFRVSRNGLIEFIGLGDPETSADGIIRHEALLNTFLQHPRTRRAESAGKPGGAITLQIDDVPLPLVYRRVQEYAHQQATFDPRRRHEIVGWQSPGGAVRHQAFGADTKLEEAPGPWLALLFAPVGAIYFRVQRRGLGLRPQFCLVLLDPEDLTAFVSARRLYTGLGVRDFVVAGAAEAGLRVLATLAAEDLLHEADELRCAVMAFGVVPWSSQQKTRLEVFEVVRLGRSVLALYERARQCMPVLSVPPPKRDAAPSGRGGRQRGAAPQADEPAEARWLVSPVPDLVARNLVAGRPWYADFTALLADRETRRQLEIYEAAARARRREPEFTEMGGLAAMTLHDGSLDEAAAALVRACHLAWRQRMGALSARAQERGESFSGLVERERERLRVEFVGCKNAATLRAALVDFWSRGGPNAELQQHWSVLLPFLSEQRWQLARDLALLALVSYPRSRAEGANDAAHDSTTEIMDDVAEEGTG